MKIGIVGSREFKKLELVDFLVKSLPKKTEVVSGGARGVDKRAIMCAKRYGLSTKEFLPENLDKCKKKHEYTIEYYKRNQKIAEYVDYLIAFTDRYMGGTWHTIGCARKLGKPIRLVQSTTSIKMIIMEVLVDILGKRLDEC